MHELRDEDEPELSEILKKVEKVDLVIIEGFKRDRHPKIEAFRQETGTIAIAREDSRSLQRSRYIADQFKNTCI